ncbi:hypothetical protein [Nodosilinea sp. E11]|uniref:hypothetical protein n=1 Tax=Nodosilinea sp. E11 TaxID=3037479 RepID=UPI002934497F|nr:hypothetical protein [Nodosilinea sp. E11]WOD37831.1 hypothetical protein RRF56_16590 [Nodosilinea sp. E11]
MTTTRDHNYDLHRQRQRLEVLVQPVQGATTLAQTLKQLGDKTVRFFTGQTEPRIWQRNRQGQLTWFAHDPMTNRTRQFSSEQDVRLWLEKRYYE